MMSCYSFRVYRDVGGGGLRPTARVVVMDAVLGPLLGQVCVSTEHVVRFSGAGKTEGAGRHARRQPEPGGVQLVQIPAEPLLAEEVTFLDYVEYEGAKVA